MSTEKAEDLTYKLILQSMLQSATPDGLAPLTFGGALTMVFVFGCLGLLWAAWNWFSLSRINVSPENEAISSSSKDGPENMSLVIYIGEKISQGAKEFLKQEYLVCLIFVFIMFFIIYVTI
jgi:Na+/H+-translocating membrane pyrophosphatase